MLPRRLLLLIVMSVALQPLRAQAAAINGIVSLDLCTDWILLTHAAPGQVRAFSPYLYQYPNPLSEPGLPTHDGSVESLLALKPALVLSGKFNAMLLRKRLQQMSIRVEVLDHPVSLDGIDVYIDQVVELIAAPVPEKISRRVFEPRQQTLLLLGANGIGTGPGTLEHEVLVSAGWKNYLQQPGYQALQLERLVVDPPDLIVRSQVTQNSLAARFAMHPALQRKLQQRMRNQPQDWRWQCPGPWTFDLVEELAAG